MAEAEALVRRALAIREESLGPDHPDVATSLIHLALLLPDTNRLAEAEPLFRRALGILEGFRRATGHEHPHERGVRENLGLAALARVAADQQ